MRNPYRIDKQVADLVAKIDYLDDYLLMKLADADEFDYARYLMERHDQLTKAKQLVRSVNEIHDGVIKEELMDTPDYVEEEDEAGSTEQSSMMTLRKIIVAVTEGMVNQSLLTLTQSIKRGTIKPFEEMRINLPSGEFFDSRVIKPGNKLRERGLIGRFYRAQRVRNGDRIILEEIAAGEWKLDVDTDYRQRRGDLSSI